MPRKTARFRQTDDSIAFPGTYDDNDLSALEAVVQPDNTFFTIPPQSPNPVFSPTPNPRPPPKQKRTPRQKSPQSSTEEKASSSARFVGHKLLGEQPLSFPVVNPVVIKNPFKGEIGLLLWKYVVDCIGDYVKLKNPCFVFDQSDAENVYKNILLSPNVKSKKLCVVTENNFSVEACFVNPTAKRKEGWTDCFQKNLQNVYDSIYSGMAHQIFFVAGKGVIPNIDFGHISHYRDNVSVGGVQLTGEGSRKINTESFTPIQSVDELKSLSNICICLTFQQQTQPQSTNQQQRARKPRKTK